MKDQIQFLHFLLEIIVQKQNLESPFETKLRWKYYIWLLLQQGFTL